MILVLEDSPEICELYEMQAEILELPILIANDIPKAAAFFEMHRFQLAVIVFDGKINGAIQPTCEFVSKIRASGFSGDMIAASQNPNTNIRLLEAGCHRATMDKHSVIRTTAELLKKAANP